MESVEIDRAITDFLVILGGSDKPRTVHWHRQKLLTFVQFLNGLLFRITPKIVPELDAGIVPAELREQFERCDKPLTGPARVEVKQPGSDWIITAGDAEYYIRQENRTLHVYANADCLPTVVSEIKATHIAQFYARLRTWGLSDATLRGYQVSVRAFFGWYYEFG